FVVAKMNIATDGRCLWTRTIGSTIVGEAVDSALFYPLAFYGTGILPNDKLPAVMLAQFVGKVAVEVVFTPLTYKIVGFLKRAEQEDYYDRGTDFNPFVLKDGSKKIGVRARFPLALAECRKSGSDPDFVSC